MEIKEEKWRTQYDKVLYWEIDKTFWEAELKLRSELGQVDFGPIRWISWLEIRNSEGDIRKTDHFTWTFKTITPKKEHVLEWATNIVRDFMFDLYGEESV